MNADWFVLSIVGAGLAAAALAVANSLIAGEVRAWLPHLARNLVRSAARRLPPDTRARYEEEWLAELAAWEDRPLSALAKAAHLRWNANSIRESLDGVVVKSERLKRVVDICSAFALLSILSPLLIAIAIAIKLESRGPVFFDQPRTGRDNTTFRLIKFRSMYVETWRGRTEEIADLDWDEGVMFKIREDPRVTRVGRLLRRYSLDELPQLFNVLRGDMTFVGPRPLVFPEEEQGSRVRPGLTSRPLLRELRLLLRELLGR